jgi:hypothetical protein
MHGNSPDHYARGTPSGIAAEAAIALRPLVGAQFQVLFTPLAGVLFTLRSRYYTLPVVEEYLALGGGPPRFTAGFT